MKVKDVVLSAANVLGIKKGVAAYFNGESTELEREAELLLNCFNNVESSLAFDYLPLYAEDTVRTATGILEFSELTYSPVRVVSVADDLGNAASFEIFPKYLRLEPGRYRLTYTYAPNLKTIDGESDYGTLSCNSLLVYGVLSEYCLAEGRYPDADAWDKKYKRAIESTYQMGRGTVLSSRRWV